MIFKLNKYSKLRNGYINYFYANNYKIKKKIMHYEFGMDTLIIFMQTIIK